MADFGFTSDDLDKRGFISKERILETVSQEAIFGLVFKEVPEEHDYCFSPFREDRNPGCWFEYHIDGKLRFKDFGNPTIVNGISMKNIDCFNAVQVYYRIPNFYLTLEFIYRTLIQGKTIDKDPILKKQAEKTERKKVKILIEPRIYQIRDKNLWDRYGITKPNLIQDRVFTLSKYHILNTKKGSFSIDCSRELVYAFTEFADSRKKLYFPFRDKKNRFLTTCTKDDIGGLSSLVPFGRLLIISKSYKDWRILKNFGKNTVWFQNEGMVPSPHLLTELVKRFDKVIVFFDNDETGIQASINLAAIINAIFPGKARPLWLPTNLLEQKITDPSDLYFCKGKEEVSTFLKLNT